MSAERLALGFIRNVAMTRTERPNDLWSTLYHVSEDALQGHTRTLNELGLDEIVRVEENES